jgi:hypothetical protein
MSKRKDPKDVAIEFVMGQPIEAASMFVSTLASIVKARMNGAQLQTARPTKAPAAAADKPRARMAKAEVSRPAPRLVDPAEVSSTGGSEAGTQPDISRETLPLQ